MTFKCEYCGSEYKRESTLAKHMCRNKKRYLQKDEQHVRLGLKFFDDWYRRAMGSRKAKTYDDFAKSQYYAAFVRFGMYVLEARIFAPEQYMHWLVDNAVKIDDWAKDSVYNRYLAFQSKKETAERGLERFVLHAQEWSERTGHHWTQYWQSAGMNRIVHDVKMGKISPWVLLSYQPARLQLEQMPDEVLNEIADTIDLAYWNRKIGLNKSTVQWIREVLA